MGWDDCRCDLSLVAVVYDKGRFFMHTRDEDLDDEDLDCIDDASVAVVGVVMIAVYRSV